MGRGKVRGGRQIFWVGAWESGIIMSILSIVSMNEPHWKTMRISGIKPLWKTMRISEIKPGIRPEESVLILSKKSPESVLSILSILSIVSMKEPGIKPQWKTMTILLSLIFLVIEEGFQAAVRAQNIIGTNLLTKFHEYRKINKASRVLTRKNAPPPGSHVFQPTGIILKLVQDIIWMNLLTKFHEDQTVNVASREKCPAPWPCFSSKHIIETNLLTKFHEDWTINVDSRELTRQMLTAHNGRRTKCNHKSSP
ncbi:hypothetical protein DPMN_018914 [Dreissena polymorpha]|uniref:Uncharacterized protein n=1 Tax=Dreissena polymorpha TaxID=45954 RepID=A0A9D4NHD3_DREPO|nr:hypothetical protein DPMN_018914 [Dreissena polymorpha]